MCPNSEAMSLNSELWLDSSHQWMREGEKIGNIKKSTQRKYSEKAIKDLRKERQRWKKRVEDEKPKTTGDLNEREKRRMIKCWKHGENPENIIERAQITQKPPRWFRPYKNQFRMGRL